MDSTLYSTNFLRADTCVRALLSPSAFPNRDSCRSACLATTRQLVRQARASALASGLPVLCGTGDSARDDAAETQGHFWKLDVGYQLRQREFGLEVLHLSMLYPRPAAGLDPRGPDHVPLGPGSLHSLALGPGYGCREYPPPSAGQGLVMVRALLPAFQNGARSHLRLDPQRSELARLFLLLADAVLACDAPAELVPEVAPLAEWLSLPPEPARLYREMGGLGAGLLRAAQRPSGHDGDEASPWSGEVHLRCYCLRGCLPGGAASATEPVLLVSLKRRRVGPDSVDTSRQGSCLTRQEAHVARLLAERRSNREIAAALGISPHTARHHTERVLVKLGLHSRADVRALLV